MRTVFCVLLCVTMGLWLGCSSDDPAGPGGASTEEIMDIVEAAGELQKLGEDKDDIIDTYEETEGDTRYEYEVHDCVDNIESVVYLGANDDIIWPGSLIKGERAHFFVYDPIVVPRSPVTLSISLEGSNAGESLVEVVQNPKLSTTRQGISNLLKSSLLEGTNVPAKVEFTYDQVFNQSHMSMYINSDISYGVGSLDAAFDWDSVSKKTKIVAKYKQIYYSIDMDTPQTPAKLFASDISASELKQAMPAGCMPLYVAGVSYGMMAIMTIETDFSLDQMGLAIDAAYSGTADVELETGFTAREMMESSSIRIVVYGGSTAGLQSIEEGFNGFMKIVDASSNYSSETPGVPLVYKFRNLCDNTLAQISMTSQYTLVRPVRLRERVRITADRFYCELSDDEGIGNNVDMDRFQVKAWAYDRNSEEEDGDPIVEDVFVYNWSTSGWETMGAGQTWFCTEPNSIEVTFDNEFHDFDVAKLRLWAYGRDYDPLSANEHGSGEVTLIGRRFFENGGVHTFLINSADFRFKVYVTLEVVN